MIVSLSIYYAATIEIWQYESLKEENIVVKNQTDTMQVTVYFKQCGDMHCIKQYLPMKHYR